MADAIVSTSFENVVVTMIHKKEVPHQFETHAFIATLYLENNHLFIQRTTGAILNFDYWVIFYNEFLEVNADGCTIDLYTKGSKIEIKFKSGDFLETDHLQFFDILVARLPATASVSMLQPYQPNQN